jgi:hypothetical protein
MDFLNLAILQKLRLSDLIFLNQYFSGSKVRAGL